MKYVLFTKFDLTLVQQNPMADDHFPLIKSLLNLILHEISNLMLPS